MTPLLHVWLIFDSRNPLVERANCMDLHSVIEMWRCPTVTLSRRGGKNVRSIFLFYESELGPRKMVCCIERETGTKKGCRTKDTTLQPRMPCGPTFNNS